MMAFLVIEFLYITVHANCRNDIFGLDFVLKTGMSKILRSLTPVSLY